jgi:hypothetical protein
MLAEAVAQLAEQLLAGPNTRSIFRCQRDAIWLLWLEDMQEVATHDGKN